LCPCETTHKNLSPIGEKKGNGLNDRMKINKKVLNP
jgi:hypothetical protein